MSKMAGWFSPEMIPGTQLSFSFSKEDTSEYPMSVSAVWIDEEAELNEEVFHAVSSVLPSLSVAPTPKYGIILSISVITYLIYINNYIFDHFSPLINYEEIKKFNLQYNKLNKKNYRPQYENIILIIIDGALKEYLYN